MVQLPAKENRSCRAEQRALITAQQLTFSTCKALLNPVFYTDPRTDRSQGEITGTARSTDNMSTSQGVNVSTCPVSNQLDTAGAWMNASQTDNADSQQVLRWSALAFGIFYGFTHQRTITAQTHAAHAQAEWKHKEDLIQKAKLEWKKKQSPQSTNSEGDGALPSKALVSMLIQINSYHGSRT